MVIHTLPQWSCRRCISRTNPCMATQAYMVYCICILAAQCPRSQFGNPSLGDATVLSRSRSLSSPYRSVAGRRSRARGCPGLSVAGRRSRARGCPGLSVAGRRSRARGCPGLSVAGRRTRARRCPGLSVVGRRSRARGCPGPGQRAGESVLKASTTQFRRRQSHGSDTGTEALSVAVFFNFVRTLWMEGFTRTQSLL